MEIRDAVPNRRDVEAKLANVGDFVKIDYLSACLKKSLDFDTRKFVLNRLAKIYEERKMFSEAARLTRASADINTTFDGKVADFMKSVELFVKAGIFDEAEVSFTKALAVANQKQKDDIKVKRKEMYKQQADAFIKMDKRKHAMQTYEKLLTFDLSADEKKDIQTKLVGLYEKLGKVREYFNVTRGF